ncbi:MAG: double-strand break repair helicase AddA [Alphaproteobacteria bacterium]|nr:double-strand break repair helicase AddA [Alphaproteobacteria bacterium]
MGVLSEVMAESRMQELFAVLVGQRERFEAAFEDKNGSGELRIKSRLLDVLFVSQEETENAILQSFIAAISSYDSALRNGISVLERAAKSDAAREKVQKLIRWCESSPEQRVHLWDDFCGLFLTQKGEPLKDVVVKAVRDEAPAFEGLMRELQARVLVVAERLRAVHLRDVTWASITAVQVLLENYRGLKQNHNLLDYDDLILKVAELFRRPGIAPWVLYKLDGGLDHLLIDEAQDTGPAQWELVETLVGEFYSGMGVHEGVPVPRTLFVVGDEKQSIYGFQGAAPKAFGEKRRMFAANAKEAGLDFASVPLGLSYRSTEAVLRAVDAVFNQPHVREGVTYSADEAVEHGWHRAGQAGRVEVWPAVRFDKESEKQKKPKVEVAGRIASQIRAWLDSGEKLESQDRPVSAGDILILVRKRADFVPAMVRALKKLDIPVAGADRLELVEHIAVMDLLALAEFLLLPEDDLSLACILKSPLCNVDEETLFNLSYGRGKATLWSRVQEHAPEVSAMLSRLLDAVDYLRPYELFAQVLEQEGARVRFAGRLGEECFDPLDEFLSLALQYEQLHPPSLQGFLQWMRTGRVEVKRDMEQGRDAVRIMTVHGAKGLQAPIVYLADTTGTASGGGSKVNAPYWFEQDGKPVVLWSPRSEADTELASTLREERKRAEGEEFRRLLYVAMTRASDRLYITGWLGKRDRDVPPESWYAWMDSALKPMGEPVMLLDGEEGYALRNPQTAPHEKRKGQHAKGEASPLPEHFLRPPEAEPFPPRPLVPSQGDDVSASTSAAASGRVEGFSPAREQETKRFRRGNLVHHLLQFLPDVQPEERRGRMETYLARHKEELGEGESARLADEVLRVLHHPLLEKAFGEGSLAEVPLTGLVTLQDGKRHILSGQVDRLLVTEEEIIIIDYKTGREGPKTVAQVPKSYLRQMALYRAALAASYPQHRIRTVLVWTSEAMVMELPEDALVGWVAI